MKTNLNWKKKLLDDKSGYWYSAKVPIINWEYIIETEYWGYIAGIFYSKHDDDVTRISSKVYNTEEAAMIACEKHLLNTAEKFNNWLINEHTSRKSRKN